MSRKRIVIIGLDPSEVDFSSPDHAHLSHLGSKGVRSLLGKDEAELKALGFHAELFFVPADVEAARICVASFLAAWPWDCVLIGNGIRSIPDNFLLFEALVNAVIQHAPRAKLCFNTRPDDVAEAVRRWIAP